MHLNKVYRRKYFSTVSFTAIHATLERQVNFVAGNTVGGKYQAFKKLGRSDTVVHHRHYNIPYTFTVLTF